MSVSAELAAYLHEQFAALGNVACRRMFGGVGYSRFPKKWHKIFILTL